MRTASNNGTKSVPRTFWSREEIPSRPEAKITGNSICSSVAPSSKNRSNTAFSTSEIRASGRSILLITTIGFRPRANALRNTKRVWGITPSAASTNNRQPSAKVSVRSTSPPKSAWPGVSTRLILVTPYCSAMFLAKIVMPRSRSRSFESNMQVPRNSLSRY